MYVPQVLNRNSRPRLGSCRPLYELINWCWNHFSVNRSDFSPGLLLHQREVMQPTHEPLRDWHASTVRGGGRGAGGTPLATSHPKVY